MITVPALVGPEPGRRVSDLCVTVANGRLHWEDGTALDTSPSKLLGWGAMDGPATRITNGVWSAIIPNVIIDNLRQHCGLVID